MWKIMVTRFVVLLACACAWNIMTVKGQTTTTPALSPTSSIESAQSPQTAGSNSLPQPVEATTSLASNNETVQANPGQTSSAVQATQGLNTAGGSFATPATGVVVMAATASVTPAYVTPGNAQSTSAMAINPSSSSTAGSTAAPGPIVGRWSAWDNSSCDSTCCGSAGATLQQTYRQTRTCSTNVTYCPADSDGTRNTTNDEKCPSCGNGKCGGTTSDNGSLSQMFSLSVLISTLMFSIGYFLA